MSLSPLIISDFLTDNQNTKVLECIALDKPPYNENWLQDIIHKNPELVPAGKIEAIFENIIPIARELPLASGFLDNLYITPEGYPVLVEVKLWKNQEARRKVVAQILEYAKDFNSLSYETLNAEIRRLYKTQKWGENPLYEIVTRAVPDMLDEAEFVDRVSRNLREGRFLLLILGDGVREEMENLTRYLMNHSLRYSFGIVQIKLFTLSDGSILALPDVMAKTQTIERHVTIVTTQSDGAYVTETPAEQERLEKTSLSLEDFYENMNKTAPQSAAWLKTFLQSLSDLSIDFVVGKNGDTLLLKAPTNITLMYCNPPNVAFWGYTDRFKKSVEGMQVSAKILQDFANIIGADVVTFPAGGMDLRINNKAVPMQALHGKDAELKEALRLAIDETMAIESEG